MDYVKFRQAYRLQEYRHKSQATAKSAYLLSPIHTAVGGRLCGDIVVGKAHYNLSVSELVIVGLQSTDRLPAKTRRP